MRWLLIFLGMGMQVFAVAMYVAARRFLRTLTPDRLAGLENKSLFAPPFVYLSASGFAWGIGVLLISIFAVIDYDPVLLFSQGVLTVIALLILLRFRIF